MIALRWIAAVLVAATPLGAQERSLAIERFDADIGINRDASLDIVERITVRFTGQWNGLYRTIPVAYRTPQGFNWTLRIDEVSAVDEAGNTLKVERSRERHYLKLKVWVPGARDVSKQIMISYRARNGLRFFEDHDELYWNVTGDEWDVPVGPASAVIRLPPGAGGVRATAFNGAYGATSTDANVSIEDNTVRLSLPTPLGFREGLTAVVGWNKGAVVEPGPGARAAGFLAANWPLFIPLPVFFTMLAIWRRRGRDPEPRPVTVQYDPPAALTPAESGTLIDNSVDLRDITATLVDLAVRGFVRIEETKESHLFGLIKTDDFTFHLLKPRAGWTGLKAHETALLDGIFGYGQASAVTLSSLENEFYKAIPGIKRAVFDGLIAQRFYQARPDNVRAAWMTGGVFFAFILGAGGAAMSGAFSLTPVPFLVAGVLVGIIMLVFGYHMPARTVAGARTAEQVSGFLEFLNRVEGDRIRDFVKTPEMFERFLPFAMAFGVEKKWARAFQDIFTEPPNWYAGSNMGQFNAGLFSSRLSAMSKQAGTTMSSSPRSSSGSGFSGGSSGGGGGGGGGGGF